MASKEAKTVTRASGPLVIGTTVLPKRVLSYRWVITDAKIFLDHIRLGGELRSPTFSVTLPRKNPTGHHHQQISLWNLLAKIYCHHVNDRLCCTASYLSISLCQDKDINIIQNDAAPTDQKSEVWISDFVLSFINSETEEVMLTSTFSDTSCVLNKTDSMKECMTNSKVIGYERVATYLCNGTLTIQVNATLHCLTDCMETLDKERESQDNVLDGMKTMFADKLFTDVTIKCGSAEFKGHKAILASQSPVFKKMLETDMKEQRSGVIDISDIDRTVISDMLSYLYTGSAPNMDTLVKELLIVANKYELSQLFAMCENKLKSEMNITNIIELLILADTHNASYLKRACFKYICHNSAAAYRTSQWKELKENCERHISLLMEIMEYTS